MHLIDLFRASKISYVQIQKYGTNINQMIHANWNKTLQVDHMYLYDMIYNTVYDIIYYKICDMIYYDVKEIAIEPEPQN